MEKSSREAVCQNLLCWRSQTEKLSHRAFSGRETKVGNGPPKPLCWRSQGWKRPAKASLLEKPRLETACQSLLLWRRCQAQRGGCGLPPYVIHHATQQQTKIHPPDTVIQSRPYTDGRCEESPCGRKGCRDPPTMLRVLARLRGEILHPVGFRMTHVGRAG